MNEIIIAVCALIVGVAIAWVWRASLARAALAPLEQQLAEKNREVESLKAEQRHVAEALRG
ncbi:MAG TPA: hypothetical protein VFZ14_06435, partial [Burkholderiales bacterium]|nr:hypothetical protein [Burkholderiales bacterium]